MIITDKFVSHPLLSHTIGHNGPNVRGACAYRPIWPFVGGGVSNSRYVGEYARDKACTVPDATQAIGSVEMVQWRYKNHNGRYKKLKSKMICFKNERKNEAI